MARRIPEHRFDELIRAATEVFIERGYHRTQMADVATAIGVAKGTLYGYVDGKDALLVACLVHADSEGPLPLPKEMPLANPKPGLIGQQVKESLAAETRLPTLELSLAGDLPEAGTPEGREAAEAELSGVVGELYDLMTANRFGIKLLDRCMDHPELQQLWQEMGREGVRLAMMGYLEARIATGHVRSFPEVRLAARFVIESCATWAVHIHWDRAPEPFEPEAMRANTIGFVTRGLLA